MSSLFQKYKNIKIIKIYIINNKKDVIKQTNRFRKFNYVWFYTNKYIKYR